MSKGMNRRIGGERGHDGRFTRVVDRMEIHGSPISFRTLIDRAIPRDARYIIFDLDRTIHYGRNMGELLGWELIAYHVYGSERLEAEDTAETRGRFLFLGSDPMASLSYLRAGLRLWAWPGLYYFAWCKLAQRVPLLRKMSFRFFGPEPVRQVQRVPQFALMTQMSSVPLPELRHLARRVWSRHRQDQVITAEDITLLRSHAPDAKIIISSASPQPVLEVAQAALGVDDIVYSSVDADDDWLAAPSRLWRQMKRGELPRNITPPSRQHINSSFAKIEALHARYPDLLDPGVVTVGITDTGYGEDHCWAQYFSDVIDVNSSSPFPPIIAATSPLRSVHSVALLTRGEIRSQVYSPGWLDPRRKPPYYKENIVYRGEELEARLAKDIDALERLAEVLESRERDLASVTQVLKDLGDELLDQVEQAAEAYNAAMGSAKLESLNHLKGWIDQSQALSRRLAKAERPISKLTYALITALEKSRATLA